MDEQPGHDKLMKTADVAKLFGVTPRAVQKWAKEGILRRVTLPGRTYSLGYLESEVKQLLTSKA